MPQKRRLHTSCITFLIIVPYTQREMRQRTDRIGSGLLGNLEDTDIVVHSCQCSDLHCSRSRRDTVLAINQSINHSALVVEQYCMVISMKSRHKQRKISSSSIRMYHESAYAAAGAGRTLRMYSPGGSTFSAWNDVMAAILNMWRQIENLPPSIDA